MPYREVDLDQAMRNVLSQETFEADGGEGTVASWLNTVTVENVRSEYDSGSSDEGTFRKRRAATKLYAYNTEGTLAEVPAHLWHIQTESGETPEDPFRGCAL